MTSSLEDAIASEPPRTRKGPPCGYVRVKAGMTPADRDRFDELLADVSDGRRTAAAVGRILQRAGHHWPGNMITRHMRRECKCFDPGAKA